MCNKLAVCKYFRYLNNCAAEFVLSLYAVYVLFSVAVLISCITGVLLSKYTAVEVCILNLTIVKVCELPCCCLGATRTGLV